MKIKPKRNRDRAAGEVRRKPEECGKPRGEGASRWNYMLCQGRGVLMLAIRVRSAESSVLLTRVVCRVMGQKVE